MQRKAKERQIERERVGEWESEREPNKYVIIEKHDSKM